MARGGGRTSPPLFPPLPLYSWGGGGERSGLVFSRPVVKKGQWKRERLPRPSLFIISRYDIYRRAHTRTHPSAFSGKRAGGGQRRGVAAHSHSQLGGRREEAAVRGGSSFFGFLFLVRRALAAFRCEARGGKKEGVACWSEEEGARHPKTGAEAAPKKTHRGRNRKIERGRQNGSRRTREKREREHRRERRNAHRRRLRRGTKKKAKQASKAHTRERFR